MADSWASDDEEGDNESWLDLDYTPHSGLDITDTEDASCCNLIYDLETGHNDLLDNACHYFKGVLGLLATHQNVGKRKIECIVNELVNSVSVACITSTSEAVPSNMKKSFCDLYLRVRHETFFSCVCNLIGADHSKSDEKFSDRFDLDSDKTPDRIFIKDKTVSILEVTVTTNVEQAAFQKGGVGYTPKYSQEIDSLTVKGYSVHYCVCILDASNSANKDHYASIKELCIHQGFEYNLEAEIDMDYFQAEMVQMQKFVSRFFIGEFVSLFSEPYLLNPRLNEKAKSLISHGTSLNKLTYSKLTVNIEIYNKIMFRWNRLSSYLSRFKFSDKISLYYDHLSPNFRFKANASGSKVSDWHIALEKDDRMFVIMNTYTELSGTITKLTDSERGLHFYTLQKKTLKDPISSSVRFKNYSVLHPFNFEVKNYNMGPDEEEDTWSKVCSKFEDIEFENKYLKLIKDWDTNCEYESFNKGMLCNSRNDALSSSTALKAFTDKLMKENDFEVTIPVKTYKHKNSFLYPIADLNNTNFINYRVKPTQFLKSLLQVPKLGEYTKAVLGKASMDGFEFGTLIDPRLFEPEYNRLRQVYISSNLKYHKAAKDYARSNNLDRIPNKKEFSTVQGFSDLHEELLRTKREFDRYVDVKNLPRQKLPLVKMNSRGKNSTFKNFFQRETLHFNKNDEQSIISGVGFNGDIENLYQKQTNLYNKLKNFLLSPSQNSISDRLMDLNSYGDVKLLKDFKDLHINDNKLRVKKLEGTNLYNSCAFVSRLCHSLMYYSQCSFSADYIAIDNLGMDNVLLMVRGGKKIFRTKQTKMFKLFYPVNLCYADYLTDNKTSSSVIHEIDGLVYLESPWMFMKEALVAEGICFLHKCMGYALMNWKDCGSVFGSIDTSYFNVYLAFHSRRKTEEFMHNFRYLLVNNMGDYSNLGGLLPEFAGFNYDYVQQYLRLCLLKKYKALADSMRVYKSNSDVQTALLKSDVKHIFNGHQITDLESLSRFIYSSYLMTKAPINQMAEQVKNLKAIMETHESAMSELSGNQVCITENDTLQSYAEKLFNSDFNYDPYFCTHIGKFISDFLMSKQTKSDITKIWESSLNKNWDSMANSKGLRGKLGQEGFFGEKGYYVICKDLISRGKLEEVLKILESSDDDYKIRSGISKLNETYRSVCKDSIDNLVFHVVDKRQRGGSREIYVMDMQTKMSQQPIESFLAKLCKMVPNELISVPSNRRLQNIHSQVFEKNFDTSNKENFYLTLDCRKWAPKSNLDKYILFILGMSDCLPTSFLKHFLNFFSLMYTKKNVTRKKVMENFLKSEANAKYKHWFKESNDASYFEMPYSFMMGIFNFLSSLMHVANQMYMSYIINLSSKQNLSRDSYLHMLAHSDDSAGKAVVANDNDMRRLLLIYEIGLKSANHLISIKKSVVSKVYFEFLSVLYIMNQLVPLLPKFMSGITFRPVDKGYCNDSLQSYSKCIELILNGAHFEQAYMYMKIQSHLIWKFYFNENPKPEDYLIPPQLGGMPDPHPLSVLLVGTDSDLLRLKYSLGDDAAGLMLKFSNLLSLETSSEEGLLKSFCAKPNIRPSKMMFMESVEKIKEAAPELFDSWSIKNLSFKNTSLNLLQSIIKTNDSTFLAALQDEEIIRRISRAYYFRSSQCIETKIGYINYRQLRKYFNAMNSLRFSGEFSVEAVFKLAEIPIDENSLAILKVEIENQTDILNKISSVLYTEVVKYYNYMDKIRLNVNASELKYKTCKPIHMNIMRTAQPLSNITDIPSVIVWLKEPRNKFLLSNVTGLQTASNVLKSYLTDSGLNLDELDCTLAYKLARKIFTSSEKDYYFYSNMPAGCRDINNYQDVCLMLANNSKKDIYFTGLNIPFARSPGVLLGDYMPTVSIEEFVETTAYLSLIIAAYSTDSKKVDLINNLDWRKPTFLGGGIADIDELLKSLKEYWKPSQVCYGYISTYLNLSIELVSGGLIIDESKNLVGDLKLISAGYFYVYVKSQKLVSNRWMGRGKILVNTPNGVFLFYHDGNRLTKIATTMKKGSMSKITAEYINMVFSESRLQTLQYSFRPMQEERSIENVLGIDRNGIICLDNRANLEFGFENVDQVDTLIEMKKLEHFKSVKIESGGSLLVSMGDELEGRSTWRLCFYPLDMAAVSKHIMTLFAPPETSLKNYQMASTGTGQFGSFIRSNLLSMFNRPLYISFENFFSGMRSSRVYNIMCTLKSRDNNCFDTLNSTEPPSGPSPSNGLLSHLVNYKDINPDFKFDTMPFLTQHLMALKSQQPENYLSTLERHMKDMYENLYTVDEKEEMMTELIEAANSLRREKSHSGMKITNLMSKWGYSAIVSGIVEFKVCASDKFHQFLIRESLDPKLSAALADKLFFILNVFYKTFKRNKHLLSEFFVDKEFYNLGYSFETFEEHFYSFIALTNYWRYKIQTLIFTNDSPAGLFLMQMCHCVLKNDALSKDFSDLLKDDDLFMHFKVDYKSLELWVMSVCSCLQYFLVKYAVPIKGSLLLDLQYDRPESYSMIKKLDFGNKLSYHSFKKFGLLSDQLISDLKIKHSFLGNHYNPTLKAHGRSIPMHNDVILEGVLSDEVFECEEWETILMELQSNEPDIDEVEAAKEAVLEEAGEFYLPASDKKRGEFNFYQLTILTALFSSKTRLLAFCSRQTGDNLLVICDSFDEDFLLCMPNARAYKPGPSWKFQLLTRDMVCILVSFRSGTPEGFTKCFDLQPIKRHTNRAYRQALLSEDVKLDLGDWQRSTSSAKNEVQLRVKKYKKDDVSAIGIEDAEIDEKRSDDDEEKKVNAMTDLEKIMVKCEERGLSKPSSEMLMKILKSLEGSEEQLSMETLMKEVLSETLNTNKALKDIKEKMSDTIKSGLKNRANLENILQVPMMLQKGEKNEKSRSNIHFRDEQVRAELDSISSNLTDTIISGTLTITEEERDELFDVIELCDSYLTNNKGSPEAMFFTMLAKMIINDAFQVEEETKEHTPIWKNLRRKLISKVVKNKGKLSQQNDPLSIPPTGSSLNYKFSGYPED